MKLAAPKYQVTKTGPIMGRYRYARDVFDSHRWPTEDVAPLNEAAKMVVDYAAAHPDASRASKAWDSDRHCVIDR